MEFMNSVGSSSDLYRPSLFELIAQDRLNELFKPAVKYIITAYAQRYPRYLLKVLKYFDEIYGLFMLIVERHYLYDWNASFSESFYGLRRFRKASSSKDEVSNGDNLDQEKLSTKLSIGNSLNSKEITNSAISLVFIPYLKCKLDDLYDVCSGGEAARLLGDDLMDEEEEEEEEEGNIDYNQHLNVPSFIKRYLDLNQIMSFGKSIKKATKRTFVKVYPLVHLLYHAVPLAYYIAYLFERTDYHTPSDHWLGLIIKRMSQDDYRAREEREEHEKAIIAQMYSKLNRPKKLLYLGYMVLKYGLNFLKLLLPMSVFFLKFLEWWYSSGNHQKSSTTYLGPLPPPPDTIKPDLAGVPLPSDTTVCPLCLRTRTNPAMLPTGYTFCYPCIFSYVEEKRKCPITFHEAVLEDIRKLFSENSAI